MDAVSSSSLPSIDAGLNRLFTLSNLDSVATLAFLACPAGTCFSAVCCATDSEEEVGGIVEVPSPPEPVVPVIDFVSPVVDFVSPVDFASPVDFVSPAAELSGPPNSAIHSSFGTARRPEISGGYSATTFAGFTSRLKNARIASSYWPALNCATALRALMRERR